MTRQELIQSIRTGIQTQSQLEDIDVRVTRVHERENVSVANIVCPLEDRTRILEVTVKELGIYEGLK